jgi:hypothetical protein
VTNQTLVVLTPSAPLQYGAEYVVTVVAAEVTDIVPATMASNYVFNFTVEPPIGPTFTDQPDSTTIAIGSSTQLSVAVTGTPAPTLQWYLGASGETLNPLSGETGTTLNTGNLSANTSYWVRATNLGGTTDSNTAVVTASNPDLRTTVSGPTSAFLEAVFDYTVGVQNTGLLPASGVTVTLTLPPGASPIGRISNPASATHFQYLECLALHVPGAEVVATVDGTLPDGAWLATKRPQLEAFQQVFGLPTTAEADAASGVAAKRPKTSAGSSAAPKPELPGSLQEWLAAYRDERLESFTIPTLKEFCKANGLPVGGKKGDLVARVHDWLEKAKDEDAPQVGDPDEGPRPPDTAADL